MKVLCICGSGMGTSMIIKLKVQSALKNLGVSRFTVEALGLGQGKSMVDSFDIVLCTKNFLSELNPKKAKLVGLKNIMDEKEIASAIKEAMNL